MVIKPKNIIQTDVEQSLKQGEVYIIFVAGSSFLSKGIKTFQQCKWNHTGIIIYHDNQWQVIEANGLSIGCTPVKNYFDRDNQYLICRIDARIKGQLTYDEWVLRLVADCGNVPYDWANLFLYQPVYFLTKRKIWIGKKDGSNAYICGEHSSFALDLYFYLVLDVAKESPVTLFERLTQQKAMVIIKTVNV
jgi:hypothetical protein